MKILHPRTFILIGLVAVIAVVFQSLTPNYLSLRNLGGMLSAMAISGIVAMGLTFVIVLRKFDLSLAGIASLSAMTLGFALFLYGNLWIAVVACIGVGVICGAINGALVGYGRLPDVVTTIAVGSIAYGMAFVYNGGADFSKNFFSSGIVAMNYTKVLGMKVPILLLLMTAIFTGFLLHMTRYGQAFYAAGENPVATRFSGISVNRMMIAGYALCGALVGLAMLIQISGIGSSRVTAGGQILLPAYTSVYLGAALLGRASIPATIAGSLVMTMLLNGFTLMSVPYYYSDAVVSLVLITAIVLFDPRILIYLKSPRRLVTG
ncbi:ABC transporter permease [uncultured Tateyamaria sp.]|uniref:ABC transporter permease n=1 Tax=uncultured Tateyamaria sp. TaxID=455651 RepID=UPI0026020700|nr:ABC transporter permease [uncultured Tateyamaria sp.]